MEYVEVIEKENEIKRNMLMNRYLFQKYLPNKIHINQMSY